jgi:lathosterol oxidase
MRSLPLVVLPIIMPTNMDLLFGTFTMMFYGACQCDVMPAAVMPAAAVWFSLIDTVEIPGYGVYLHWGFELPYPNAHHKWINTAYHHNLHHMKSIYGKALHTGFFFQIWDKMAGSTYSGNCVCAKWYATPRCALPCAPPARHSCLVACGVGLASERERGERSLEKFKALTLPDYSVLLSLDFWKKHPIFCRAAVVGDVSRA